MSWYRSSSNEIDRGYHYLQMIIDKEDITLNTIVEATDCMASHVLEIGCGDGRLTSGLAKNSGSLIAIDPDAESLVQARKRAPSIDFRIGSGENLGFNDNSFHLVLFTLSLHHQDGRKALAEAVRVTQPDGMILIIEPAVDSEVSLICNLYEDETTALLETIDTIERHASGIANRWQIVTEWEFTDVLELLDWLGSFYGQDSSPDRDRQVLDMLGDKQFSRPLLLSDKLACTMLHMSV